MRHVCKVIKNLPGNLFDNAFQDVSFGTIMAITIWESQEAFQAAMPAMREAVKAIPFDEWEARPREFHTLNPLW